MATTEYKCIQALFVYLFIYVFTEITESKFLPREISALSVDNGVNRIHPTEIIYFWKVSIFNP